MNAVVRCLIDMTTMDERRIAAPVNPLSRPDGRALERRTALDLSVGDELLRGELRGAELSPAHREVLSLVVANELAGGAPLAGADLRGAGLLARLFSSRRRARRLDALIGMTLVRRGAEGIRPTVAGIAAVCRPSELPSSEHPPRELLRALRRAEIGGMRN